MNEFAEALRSLAWAMDAKARDQLIAKVAAVTQAQVDHMIRAINEKPELLERMHVAYGRKPPNTKRRSADASEDDLDVRGGVAHVAIEGPMMKQVPSILNWLGVKATSTEVARAELAAAVESDRVDSIVLDIDSPGGTVDGTAALADDVAAVRGLKPITAVVPDLCASAAMWVASQAEAITIGPSASVGSIGVFSVVEDSSRAANKAGIETHVVSSHELKGAFVKGSKVTQAQIDDLKRNVDAYNDLFISAVASGRGMSEAKVRELATGQTWVGVEALKRGLVDAVGGTESTQGGSAAARLDHTQEVAGSNPASATNYGAAVAIPREALDIGINAAIPAAQHCGDVGPTPARREETEMDEKERAELERLRAENATLTTEKAESDAAAEKAKVALENEQAGQREALLDKYANRIQPAAAESVAKLVRGMATTEEAEAWLKDLPQIDRPDRETGAEVAEVVELIAKHGHELTVEERSMCKMSGRSPERVRDMQAVGEHVERIEHELTTDENGNQYRKPFAIMKDGRRVEGSALTKLLSLRGALTGIAMFLALAIGGVANATALTDARSTSCKLNGVTKSYLMTASSTIYKGSLVMVDSAGTVVAAAAAASNQNVAGVAQETKTSAASGSYWIRVSDDVICKFAGTTLGQDDVGVIVYAEDDQTVDETAGTNEPVAGVLVQYISASEAWIYVSSRFSFGRVATTADPTTMAGDLTLGGGAGAATFTDSASSIVTPANDATALLIGPAAMPGLITIDSQTGADEVNIVGTTATSVFRVDTGFATFDEQAVLTSGADVNGDILAGGGAGALTFDAASASILVTDNSSTGLDIGSAGLTNGLRYDSTDNAENLVHTAGFSGAAVSITGVTTLDYSNCGKTHFLTADADGDDITLPPLATVTTGCQLTFVYTGADAGCLVDLSPNASDGIEGGCTVAAAVDYASGTDDADFGLTKATSLTGDMIQLTAGNADDWYITGCVGIWTNN